jgi:long-chain acyl-CoA synthetase
MRQYQTIVAALKEHAFSHPKRMAVWAEGEQLNYAKLYQLVCGFAQYLAFSGLQRGDRIVMQTQQSLQFVVAHYGTHLAGGIFVPLEKQIVTEELKTFMEQTQAFLLISERKSFSTRWLDGRSVLENAKMHVNDSIELIFPQPEEPAELLFTTGSTGKAKGVLCSHANIFAVAENLITGMKYHPDTLLVTPGPLNHANSIRKVSTSILNGSGIVILNGMLDISEFFRVMDVMPVTGLCLPPAAVSMLLRLSKDRLGNYADQIEFIESGTAPLPTLVMARLRELLPHSRLYNSYGLTEVGSCCMYDYNQMNGLKNCIGRAAVNAHFIIVDENRREIQSSKENSGYLAVGGDAVMMGYWNSPNMTAQVMENGYFYTTDIGYIEDNLIYLVARKDEMIQVGGYKVKPIEVEEAAMRCPEVEDCACIAVEDPYFGQLPKLYVVLRNGVTLDEASISNKLREKLVPFKMPRQIEAIDAIPRSSIGKILRLQLA